MTFLKTKSTVWSAIFNLRVLVALFALLLFSQLGLGRAQTIPAADYDAVHDFSITSNPNGAWSYGWLTALGSPLNLYTVIDTTSSPGVSAWLASGTYAANPPYVAHNDTSGVVCNPVCFPPTYLHLHPGPLGELTVVRWTAPTSGNYVIQGRVQGLNPAGTTTTLYLVVNSQPPPLNISVTGYRSPTSFHHLFTVSAGDTIDIAIDYGSNSNYINDSTGIQFNITQSPL